MNQQGDADVAAISKGIGEREKGCSSKQVARKILGRGNDHPEPAADYLGQDHHRDQYDTGASQYTSACIYVIECVPN